MDESLGKREVDHWNRQQQWVVDLNLMSQQHMLTVGVNLTKVVGLLCGAALLALVGAVEKVLICKSAAYWASLAYLMALSLIMLTQVISAFNMKYVTEVSALIVSSGSQDDAISKNSDLANQIVALRSKIKKSYWLG